MFGIFHNRRFGFGRRSKFPFWFNTEERDPTIVKVTILLMGRDCSGDGVTGDGGYGDITGDKIFTGEVID